MVVCPYPVYENEHALCGFRTTTNLNCTLEIRNLERDVTRVAYRGEGEYCITTSLENYQFGAAICNIHNTTFCIKPHIPTRIGLIEMVDIHRREKTLINANEELKQSLGDYFERFDTRIILLSEKLQQIRTQLTTAHKTFVKVVQQTGEMKKNISEIRVTIWWEDL